MKWLVLYSKRRDEDTVVDCYFGGFPRAGTPSVEVSPHLPDTVAVSLFRDDSLCLRVLPGHRNWLPRQQIADVLALFFLYPQPLGDVTSESSPLPFSPGNLFVTVVTILCSSSSLPRPLLPGLRIELEPSPHPFLIILF